MNVRVAHIAAIRPFMAAARPKGPRGRPPLPGDETTPGGRLRALRERAGKRQRETADALGIERPMLSRYENNAHTMPDHVTVRAAEIFGVTPAFIRFGDTQSHLAQVRGRVGAGGHVEAFEAPSRYVEVPASWTDALPLEIDGLSCYPVYEDKDVIVIRGEHRLIESEFLGRMCVVETHDGLGLVKRVRRGSAQGLYTLESPNAPPLEDVTLSSARPVRLHLPS